MSEYDPYLEVSLFWTFVQIAKNVFPVLVSQFAPYSREQALRQIYTLDTQVTLLAKTLKGDDYCMG